jgi:hypothetical protein
MASEENPSIYYDRGTIGSSEELDEYGVWVKSEPQDLSPVNADAGQTAEDEEEDFSPDPAGDLPDFDDIETEPWLDEVSTDMADLADFNITSSGDSDSPGDSGFSGDGLGFISGSGTEEQDESAGLFEEADLSGIPMEDFLVEPPENEDSGPPGKVPEEKAGPEEFSTQLLIKIAHELSSIKDELASLKQELHRNKTAGSGSGEQGGSGGFFDEEDDEKIALTGDELDNILHTADFTEETGASVLGFDAEFPDIPAAEAESPEEAASSSDFPGEPSETGADFPALPAGNMEIHPDLEHLREKGAEPMTPAPEDTSFLEEDPVMLNLPEEGSFVSSFDFDDAVIEEPDLSGELKENPIEEPSLESLPLELDMEILSGEDEEAGLPVGSGDTGGDIEELELNLDDADIPAGLGSGEISVPLSLDGDLLDADISIDDLIPSEDETPEAAGDSRDEDAYDQVIPEGFLVESEDSPAPDENDGLLESAGDPLVLDDILEIGDIPEDDSAGQDPADGETEAGVIPAEEDGGPIAPEFEEENAEEVPPSDAAEAEMYGEPALPEETAGVSAIPSGLKNELRSVLSYMDQLLESLPEEKIEEFAKSEQFNTYKKLFEELGLV